MHTSYAGAAGMLLYINGGVGLTIELMVSEKKIETWKVYGHGRRGENSD